MIARNMLNQTQSDLHLLLAACSVVIDAAEPLVNDKLISHTSGTLAHVSGLEQAIFDLGMVIGQILPRTVIGQFTDGSRDRSSQESQAGSDKHFDQSEFDAKYPYYAEVRRKLGRCSTDPN